MSRIVAGWRITESGSGADVLVSLPGALGAVDAARHALAPLAAQRRVVAVEYPRARSMAELCDGLVGVLDALGLERVDLLGGSLGGFVAQCMVRRHPGRVRDLVLSHTFVVEPDHAWRFRLAIRASGWVPASVFARMLRARLVRVLEPMRVASPERYDALLAEVLGSVGTTLTRESVAEFNGWLLDAMSWPRFTPADLAGRRVLILESDDDPVVRAEERAALRAMYPGAEVHTFHGTGHIGSLVRPDEFAAVLDAFLDAGPGGTE